MKVIFSEYFVLFSKTVIQSTIYLSFKISNYLLIPYIKREP